MSDNDDVDGLYQEQASKSGGVGIETRTSEPARESRRKPGPRKRHPRAKRSSRGRPRAPAQIDVNMRAYISRPQAARLLGHSITQMRRDEEIWFPETSIKRKGVTYYPRQQFEELRRSKLDDGGFECYELFAKGFGPHEVTMRLRHRKPAMVRMYYRDYLANVELEASHIVLALDPGMNSEDWKRAFGFPVDRPLHQAWIRTALERVAWIDDLRNACDSAVLRFEEEARGKRKPEGGDL